MPRRSFVAALVLAIALLSALPCPAPSCSLCSDFPLRKCKRGVITLTWSPKRRGTSSSLDTLIAKTPKEISASKNDPAASECIRPTDFNNSFLL